MSIMLCFRIVNTSFLQTFPVPTDRQTNGFVDDGFLTESAVTAIEQYANNLSVETHLMPYNVHSKSDEMAVTDNLQLLHIISSLTERYKKEPPVHPATVLADFIGATGLTLTMEIVDFNPTENGHTLNHLTNYNMIERAIIQLESRFSVDEIKDMLDSEQSFLAAETRPNIPMPSFVKTDDEQQEFLSLIDDFWIALLYERFGEVSEM